MRKILGGVWKVLAAACVFVTFIVSLFGAAAAVSGLRILNEDFLILFAFPAMVVGGVAMAWIFRKGLPEPPVGYLLPIGLLLFMGAVPTLVAVINVKLDRSPSRVHRASVIYAESRGGACRCALREETLGVFWITLPDGQKADKGAFVEIVTRPGALGFAWIERVGPDPARDLPKVER